MAGSTTNLGLVKPIGTEQALVSVINGNMDIIDSKMGAVPANKNVQGQIDTLNSNITTLSARTNGELTLKSGSATGSIKYEKVGKIGILTIDVIPSGVGSVFEIVEPQSVIKPIQTTYSTLLDVGCYFYATGSVGIYAPTSGKNYVGQIVFITTL